MVAARAGDALSLAHTHPHAPVGWGALPGRRLVLARGGLLPRPARQSVPVARGEAGVTLSSFPIQPGTDAHLAPMVAKHRVPAKQTSGELCLRSSPASWGRRGLQQEGVPGARVGARPRIHPWAGGSRTVRGARALWGGGRGADALLSGPTRGPPLPCGDPPGAAGQGWGPRSASGNKGGGPARPRRGDPGRSSLAGAGAGPGSDLARARAHHAAGAAAPARTRTLSAAPSAETARRAGRRSCRRPENAGGGGHRAGLARQGGREGGREAGGAAPLPRGRRENPA